MIDKRELIHKALKSIKKDLEHYKERNDTNSSMYLFGKISGKLETLFDMGLINVHQWSLLHSIITKYIY